MRRAASLIPSLIFSVHLGVAAGGDVFSPVTLPDAIDEALSKAPDVLAANEGLSQARADLRTASLFPNPNLSAGTTLQHLPGGQFSPSNPGGPPQYNVDLAQQVDTLLFGKRTAAIESAKRAVDVAEADFADQKRRRAP